MKQALGLASGEEVFKIGFSTNLDRRIESINSYLPYEDALCWKLVRTQWHEDEINAWSMEQRIFDLLEASGCDPLKGEIVSSLPDKLDKIWAQALLSAKRPTEEVAVEVDEVLLKTGFPLSRE